MRINGLDRLKFIAAIAVVLLHAGAFGAISPLANQLVGNGLLRMAVPIFAILSGYFFASRNKPRAWFPWLTKIVKIYVFLMLLYTPFWIGNIHSAGNFINTWVIGYFHLWYLPSIVIAAILTHYGAQWRFFDGLVVLFAIIGIFLQYYDILAAPLKTYTFRNGIFFLLPFFLMGYRLSARSPAVGAVPVIVSLLAVIAESWAVYHFAQATEGRDILVSLYIACPLLVAFCIERYRVIDCPPRTVYKTSDIIYFLHIMAINLLRDMGISNGIAVAVLTVVTSITIALAWMRLKRKSTEGSGKGPQRGR